MIEGRQAHIVKPKNGGKGNLWVWRKKRSNIRRKISSKIQNKTVQTEENTLPFAKLIEARGET